MKSYREMLYLGEELCGRVFFDGKSHYYVDGATLKSGVVHCLVYDEKKDKYYELIDGAYMEIV